MFGRELAPIGLGHQAALGDADKGIVRLIVVLGRKQGLVRGDERNPALIGECDERRLDLAFAAAAMALQFNVEPVAEQPLERGAACLREMALPGGDCHVERSAGAAGQHHQAFGLSLEPGKTQMRWLIGRGFEKGAGVKPHQAAIAALARGQKNDARAFELRGAPGMRQCLMVGKVDSERAADDRLNPRRRHLVGEFERTEHVVGVGERERRLAIRLGELAQPRDRERAFEQRIGRVHV